MGTSTGVWNEQKVAGRWEAHGKHRRLMEQT